MRVDLVPPSFDDGQIEIRVREDGVSIDATQDGLDRLLRLLIRLKLQAKRSGQNEHLHLEDYELLTSRSPPCVIGLFVQRHHENTVQVTDSRARRRAGWATRLARLFGKMLSGVGAQTRRHHFLRMAYYAIERGGAKVPHIDSPPLGWHHWPWE